MPTYPPPLLRPRWNPGLGGHFETPLARWVELYTQGWLRFEKWGHLDNISNYPVENALFIDYDGERLPRCAQINKINSAFRAAGLSYMALRITKTARGWHYAFITKSPLVAMARVAMEAILGDDPMRAAMNFARARNADRMPPYWRQRWNILYDWKVTNV